MNKRVNPFYPLPAAPAGPHQPYAAAQAAQPPAAAQQYNYAGYWAQAQQYQQQAQWAPHPPAAPPPPAPPAAPPAAAADHAALYANYGYGPQHTWTQPAQVQPGHQPQQQSAIPIPYSTPYAASPAAIPQAPPAVPAYVPQQPQYHPVQPAHQGYRPPGPPAPVHHAPPPHLPPAKRPRLGGPPPQQQPRFHAPAPPAGPHNRNGPPQQAPQQTGPGVNQTPLGGRGGGSFGNAFLHANLGGGRGGGPRGGGPMRGGHPGHMGRGGMRGRGGGAFGGGARLGPPPPSAPMRGAPRGPGAMNRRQRPAANGQQVHRSAPGQGRGGGPSKQSNHPADRNQFSNSNSPSKAKNANAAAKRTEPQRTFTDFRLVGLKMRGNTWSWGTVPQDEIGAASNSEAVAAGQDGQPVTEHAKSEATSSQQPPLTPQAAGACRIRIYFHNPKINGEAVGPGPSSPTVARAGKRKKMDDDDDVEFESEQRARRRPPPGFALKKESSFADTGSGEASVRGSLFGDGDGDSVTRREMSISASHAGTEEPEEDWLMAAIADGSGAAADTDVAAAGDHAHAPATTLPNAGASTNLSAPVAPVDADGSITVDAAVPPVGAALAADPSTAPEQHAVQPGLDTEASAADNSLISSLYDAPPTHEASAPDVPAARTTESAPVPASSVPVSSGSPSASAVATAVASDHGVDATVESAVLATSEVDHDDSLPVEETEMDVSAEYGQDAGSMFSPSSHLDDHASAVDDASVTGADASTNVGDQSILVMDDSAIGWSRLSVTYAGGAKRLVFDSAVVQKMTINRAEGRIDIDLKVEKLGEGPALQGIILETLVSAATQEYEAMSWATVDDITIPPFATLESPSNITLVAYLDRDKPLATPKWLKTGDLQEWLKVSLGKAAAVPGEDSWIGRIEVVDPDPPPSIHTVLDTWARSSSVGNQAERLAFVDEHMKDVRNILEILLRLVRSDRAGPFNPRTEQQSAPLAAAIPHGSGLANHQTHITLAILAVYKLAEDQALSAGTLATLTSHIGEIVRCIPQHLIHKSLDAIYGAKIGVVVPATNGKKQGK